MKVSCILTSFNRPKWVKDSLRSIANQTHKDVQLVVIDESDAFDVRETLKEFSFPDLVVRRFEVAPEVRRLTNRLSENCNLGLSLATGDLVTFLADDDYYFPGWFAAAAAYFGAHPEVKAAFGRLVYSYKPEMTFPFAPEELSPEVVRFYKDAVYDPFGKLDHNQVMHRRFDPSYRWPTGAATVGGPDAHYFRAIARDHVFWPIPVLAAVKRIHRKGLMESQQIYLGGCLDGLRE